MRSFTHYYICFEEVERNLALMGVATQSSNYNQHTTPDLVIDGDQVRTCEYSSCSRTKPENGPWWKVTFKYDILVREVIIIRYARKLLTDISYTINVERSGSGVELCTRHYENPGSNYGCGVKTLGKFVHSTLLLFIQLNT